MLVRAAFDDFDSQLMLYALYAFGNRANGIADIWRQLKPPINDICDNRFFAGARKLQMAELEAFAYRFDSAPNTDLRFQAL